MKRQLLCWEIALCLIWSCCAPAFAIEVQETSPQETSETSLEDASEEENALPPESVEEESNPENDAQEEVLPLNFEDVKPEAFYYEAVRWAVRNGITNGTDAAHFSPDKVCTKAQILVMIWRAAGKPMVSGGFSYADVSPGSDLDKALRWAYSKNGKFVEENLSRETQQGNFVFYRETTEENNCTRADAMRYFWAFLAEMPEPNLEQQANFDDVGENHPDFKAIIWGVQIGITNGTNTTLFSPDNLCMRKTIVAFLYRYLYEHCGIDNIHVAEPG